MTRAHAAALTALLLLSAPAAAEDDWPILRNEMETVEFQAPPGFKDIELKNPNFVKHISYEEGPYKGLVIKVGAYQGQTKLEHFMKFIEKDIGGTVAYVDGSNGSRFASDLQGQEGKWYVAYVQAKCETTYGYYIKVLCSKDLFDTEKALWDRVLDSFKTFSAPQETYKLPPTWKAVKNEMYAVLGPVNEIKDAKLRQQLENRLFRVSSWLDNTPTVKMLKESTGDTRKYMPRSVIHVHPTPEAFKEAAGEGWYEGATAIYLPDHEEKVLLLDGSPDSGLTEADLAAEAGVQYMETRVGPMAPWLRAAFHLYFEAGFKSRCMPGVFPPEMLKRGKEVFGKSPPTLEDLMKRDVAGMRELGPDGAVAAWGILQCGLHGSDGAVRNLFRKFLREAVAAKATGPAWDKAVEGFKVDTKRVFKPRDVDSAAKKYFKELKEEKK